MTLIYLCTFWQLVMFYSVKLNVVSTPWSYCYQVMMPGRYRDFCLWAGKIFSILWGFKATLLMSVCVFENVWWNWGVMCPSCITEWEQIDSTSTLNAWITQKPVTSVGAVTLRQEMGSSGLEQRPVKACLLCIVTQFVLDVLNDADWVPPQEKFSLFLHGGLKERSLLVWKGCIVSGCVLCTHNISSV